MAVTPGVTVLIPTKNEAKNLPIILAALPDIVDEVIVIDGNSSDNTREVAENHPRVSKVVIQSGKGKGGALSLGMRHASREYVVNLDADGSMDPNEIPRFITELVKGADVVRGSRYLPTGGSSDLTTFRSSGNRMLTTTANLLYGVDWTDVTYGYAAFRKSALEQMDVFYFDSKVGSPVLSRGMSYGQGFEIECLIFCRSVRRGLIVVEVPSMETPRWHGASNLMAIPDGIRSLMAIGVERMRSRRLRLDELD